MRIDIINVFVDDQAKALRFYTEVLGFEKKRDIPLEEFSRLTVVSEDEQDGAELLLEPAVRPFKSALVEDGIPSASFAVDDVHAEHERLVELGVRFVHEPVDLGPAVTAAFDDTCGNLIQIAAEK